MVNRRQFVRIMGIGGAMALAAACGTTAPPAGAPTTAPAAPKPTAGAQAGAATPTAAAQAGGAAQATAKPAATAAAQTVPAGQAGTGGGNLPQVVLDPARIPKQFKESP